MAEALPLEDRSFATAMATLTVHHWRDPAAGVGELRRVADHQFVLYFEPLRERGFWGLEYFPEAADLDTEREPPGERLLRELLDVRRIPIPLPHDCRDTLAVVARTWLPAGQPDPQRKDLTERPSNP